MVEIKSRGWPPGCGRLAKVAGLMLWRKWGESDGWLGVLGRERTGRD